MPVDNERAALIAQALETPESRAALGRAMVEPIRRALDYQGIGRQLLSEEFDYTQEEEIQSNYLLWASEVKLENSLNSYRNTVKNAILQLEIGD